MDGPVGPEAFENGGVDEVAQMEDDVGCLQASHGGRREPAGKPPVGAPPQVGVRQHRYLEGHRTRIGTGSASSERSVEVIPS